MQIGWEQIRQDKIRLDQYWIDLDLNGKMDLDRLDHILLGQIRFEKVRSNWTEMRSYLNIEKTRKDKSTYIYNIKISK